MLNSFLAHNTGISVAMEYRHIHPGILSNHGPQIGNEMTDGNYGASFVAILAMFEGILDLYESCARDCRSAIEGADANDFSLAVGHPLPSPASQSNTEIQTDTGKQG